MNPCLIQYLLIILTLALSFPGEGQVKSRQLSNEHLFLNIDTSQWQLNYYEKQPEGDETYFLNIFISKELGGNEFFLFRNKLNPSIELVITIEQKYYISDTLPSDQMKRLIRIREEECSGNEIIQMVDYQEWELTFIGKFGDQCFGHKPEERVVRILYGKKQKQFRNIYTISYTVAGRYFNNEERSTAIYFISEARLVN